MPKLYDEPLRIIQVRIFESDYQKLKNFYAQDEGINGVIRTIVHKYIQDMENAIQRALEMVED